MDSQQFFKCKKHNNKEILFVKVNNIKDGDDVLFCDQCPFSKLNFSIDDCAPLKQILDQVDESPIFNLFPLSDQDLIKQLKEIFHNNTYEEIPMQINKFYDNLQEKIISMIGESKKKSLILAQQLSEQKQKVIEKYNQTINIDEIKNIFNSKSSNLYEIQNKYKQFFKLILQSQDSNNIQSLKELVIKQEKIYQELKLVQHEIISSNLEQIKNENNFIQSFSLVLPQKIDLMPSLQFKKVKRGENLQNLEDSLKTNNDQKINFISIENQQKVDFFESNIVLDKIKVYLLRFKIVNQSTKIQFFLCSTSLNQQMIEEQFQNQQYQNFCGYSEEQNLQKYYQNFSFQFQNNVNRQIYLEQAGHIIQNQNFILPAHQEAQIEIKILISKGIYEVRDYLNQQNVAILSHQNQDQLKNSKNEFKFIIRGNVVLLEATELEYELEGWIAKNQNSFN